MLIRGSLCFFIALVTWANVLCSVQAQERDAESTHEASAADEATLQRDLALGIVAVENGFYDQALLYLENVHSHAQKHPKINQKAVVAIIEIYTTRKQTVLAHEWLDSSRKILEPTEFAICSAKLSLMEHQTEEARLQLNRIELPVTPEQSARIFALRISIEQAEGAWNNALSICTSFEKLLVEHSELAAQWKNYLLFRKIYFLVHTGYSIRAVTMLDPQKIQLRTQLETCEFNLLLAFAYAAQSKLYDALKYYDVARVMPVFARSFLTEEVATDIANRFLGIKQNDVALRIYRDAYNYTFEIDRKAAVLKKIIDVHVLSEDVANEIKTRSEYIETFPMLPDVYGQVLRLTSIQMKNNKKKNAFSTYEYALARLPLSEMVRLNLQRHYARDLYQAQQYVEVETLLKPILNTAISDDAIRGEMYYLLGSSYQHRHLDSEALHTFQALSLIPEWHARALNEKMLLYIDLQQYDQAYALTDSLIASPDTALMHDALFFKGFILNLRKESDSALAVYDSYIQIQPSPPRLPEALYEAGKIAYYRSSYLRADHYFLRLSKEFPENPITPKALYLQIHTAYQSGNEAVAVNLARDVAKRYPESEYATESLFWLANYYFVLQEYQSAIAVLDPLAQRAPDAVYRRALLEKASALKAWGKSQDAINLLLPILDSERHDIAAQQGNYMVGDILSASGKYFDATPYYSKAYELDTQSPLGVASLGRRADCLCSEFSATAEFDILKLRLAQKDYQTLLNYSFISDDIREQTYWKLGHVLQLCKQNKEALHCYMTPILMRLRQENTLYVTDVWLVKCVHSALQILHNDEENRIQNRDTACKLIQIMIDLKIEPVAYWNKLQADIENTTGK